MVHHLLFRTRTLALQMTFVIGTRYSIYVRYRRRKTESMLDQSVPRN